MLNLFKETEVNEVLMTVEDIPFNSSSAADAIVKCRLINELKSWKSSSGRTLDDVKNS